MAIERITGGESSLGAGGDRPVDEMLVAKHSEHLPTKDLSITIPSMSCLGDKLHLYLNGDGDMWITFEEEDRAPNACFDREQQLRLRDWLNKVLA